jgi:hypothetical protein
LLVEQAAGSSLEPVAARRHGLQAVAQAAMNFDESVMKR